jgi:hypothetical protein
MEVNSARSAKYTLACTTSRIANPASLSTTERLRNVWRVSAWMPPATSEPD